MRIAYVCGDPGVPVFGTKGCSIHVQEVIRALRHRGASIELFAVRPGGEPPADLAGLRVHRLPVPVPAASTPAAREAALLDAQSGWPALLARAGRFDALYERYSLWSHAALEHARRAGMPALLEVNAPLLREHADHRGLSDAAGAERSARRAFAAADHLLAVSEEVGTYLAGFPEAAGRVHVIPNGVDTARFATAIALRERPREGRGPAGFTVGFVGTFKPWHGTHLLLEAFAALAQRRPDARLVLVGDGPERPRLELQARTLGLQDRVTFTGAVPPESIPSWLGAMDAAVAPYPALDGFYFSPLKLYEYMAAGLPVVASRIGQIPRIVTHDATGLLVEPGQPGELTLALEALAADPALRSRLGRAARTAVEDDHTWSAVAARILQLLAPGRARSPRVALLQESPA